MGSWERGVWEGRQARLHGAGEDERQEHDGKRERGREGVRVLLYGC